MEYGPSYDIFCIELLRLFVALFAPAALQHTLSNDIAGQRLHLIFVATSSPLLAYCSCLRLLHELFVLLGVALMILQQVGLTVETYCGIRLSENKQSRFAGSLVASDDVKSS